jgi:hypothetical protein
MTTACFGKLYDGMEDDCGVCKVNKECQAMMAGIVPPTMEEEVTASIAVEVAVEADPTIVEPVVEAVAEPAAEAAPKKRGRKGKPKAVEATPTKDAPVTDAPKSTKERTAMKTSAFRKEGEKFVFLDSADPSITPDLVVSTGDIVKIINPRSKYNGQQFVISCFSAKYDCFRGVNYESKKSADFLAHQIEVVERAVAAKTE